MVNRVDDIFPLLHFLGVERLGDKRIFQRAISIPVQNGDDAGLACLRLVMSHVALRRSKATANVKLTTKSVHLTRVSFEDGSPHKAVYEALFGTVRLAMQAVMQEDEKQVLKNYTNIFEKLLRLRQACCSGKLVPLHRREKAMELWNELQERDVTHKLTAKEGLELFEKLKGAFSQEVDLPECAVCLTEMEESECVILRKCSHVYCEGCIGRVAAHNNDKMPIVCPLCRTAFSKADMIKKSVASIAAHTKVDGKESDVSVDDAAIGASPKILALLESIKSLEQDSKAVIFSQFTSFLDLIQAALKDAGHTFTRLDGSMTAAKRIESVHIFSSDDEGSPRFMLASTLAAGTGIK